MPKLPFDVRVARYDEPPPDRLEEGDLQRLCDAGRFREANRLAAWIDVEDDTIVAHGQEGGGLVGSTQLRLGPAGLTVPRRVRRPQATVRRSRIGTTATRSSGSPGRTSPGSAAAR